uniref:Predicted protein n=1 Tax=Hordeum vulgare subsp. vulgare TaxID=112509 RepID=F2CV97_HORVV|nr:predicted protein [Hordeum vulgare subsp. vulgare]
MYLLGETVGMNSEVYVHRYSVSSHTKQIVLSCTPSVGSFKSF